MPCFTHLHTRPWPCAWLTHLFPLRILFLAGCLFAMPGSAASGSRAPLPDAGERDKLPPDGGPDFNRLIHETSPYLNQHARNPVDWFPWGEEALRRAREEDKPIFLSIGYSSCHWCHVMEHESFEHPEVAALLKRHFISIKVDREERPDLDEIYMTATQLLTGRGGWPNSIWLMPDGRPFFAGTYYPREPFMQLLDNIATAWATQRADLESQAARLSESIQQSGQMPGSAGARAGPEPDELVSITLGYLQDAYDPAHGGFGRPPKFPPHSSLRLLLTRQHLQADDQLLALAAGTLDAMAKGGIHDHAGGGFHRYSTDRVWLVPHFEKMLYDNAQLLRVYAEAYGLTGQAPYRRAAQGIADWIEREMTSEQGGFYSSLDADSDGVEGKYYVWTTEELKALLGKDAAWFAPLFQADKAGNFHDEASREATGSNILHLDRFLEEQLPTGQSKADFLAAVRKQLALLEQHRRTRRAAPALDEKILTSWNGLMIGALAQAGRILEKPDYIERAARAADYLLTTHRTPDGRLLRTSRFGRARLMAYLDDYAFLADGLLDMYDVTGSKDRLAQARELAGMLRDHFEDPNGGFFFTAHDHETLLTRGKEPFDRALPSGNAVAARVFYRLYVENKRPEDLETARNTVSAFLPLLARAPRANSTFVELIAVMRQDQVELMPDRGPLVASVEGPGQVAPGSSIELTVVLDVAEGWHVNAADPGQENLIPLKIEVVDPGGLTLTEPAYPKGQALRIEGFDEAALVYSDRLRIPVKLTVPAILKPGPRDIRLAVHWQACDEQRCLPPETTLLNHPLQITP